MLSTLYATTIPSVCPSLCLSVTRVDQSKTVEVSGYPSNSWAVVSIQFVIIPVSYSFIFDAFRTCIVDIPCLPKGEDLQWRTVAPVVQTFVFRRLS